MTVRELLTKWGFVVDEKPLKNLDSTLGTLKVGVAAVLGAATAAAGALFGLAASTAKAGDEARKTAQAVGLHPELFQELAWGAELADVSSEELAGSLAIMQRKLVDAAKHGGRSAEAFTDLGISIKDSQGNLRSADEILLLVADKFKEMPDGPLKTAASMEIFSRSGAKMIPLLNAGADGIAAMGQEARDLALVLTDADTVAAEDFNDSIRRLFGSMEGLRNIVGTELIPVVSKIAKEATAWVVANRKLIASKAKEWVKKLGDFVKTVWSAAKKVVAVFHDLAAALGSVGGIVETLMPIIQALMAVFAVQAIMGIVGAFQAMRAALAGVNAMLLANPIIAVLALMAVAVALWIANWDEIRDAGRMAWNGIKEAWSGLTEFFSALWDAGAEVIGEALAWIETRFNEFAGFFGDIGEGIRNAFVGAFDWILGKVKAVVDAAKRVARFLGIGGEKPAVGPRSALAGGVTPATAPATSAKGTKNVNVDARLEFNLPAGVNPAQAEAMSSQFRKIVHEELGAATRNAVADTG